MAPVYYPNTIKVLNFTLKFVIGILFLYGFGTTDTESNSSHSSDYSDEEEIKRKREVQKQRKESWEKELRKLSRGKALLSKDGRPLRRVKGRKMTRKTFAKKTNDFPNKAAKSHQGRSSDGDSDAEENTTPSGVVKPTLKRQGSSSVKTAEDVFSEYYHYFLHARVIWLVFSKGY